MASDEELLGTATAAGEVGALPEEGALALVFEASDVACGCAVAAGGRGSDASSRSRQSMNDRNGAPHGAPTELRTHGQRQLIDPSA